MATTTVLERTHDTEVTTSGLDEVKAYIDGALAYWDDCRKVRPLDELQEGVENGLNIAGMATLTGRFETTEQLGDHFRHRIGRWEDVRKDKEWTDYERGHVLGLTIVLKHIEQNEYNGGIEAL